MMVCIRWLPVVSYSRKILATIRALSMLTVMTLAVNPLVVVRVVVAVVVTVLGAVGIVLFHGLS